jgi:hypothetical protein
LFNIVEKAILHNKLSQKLTAMAVEREWLKPVTIRLVPGNVYLFWDYRSLHGNDSCHPPHKPRATALYHFGDPHRDSALGAWCSVPTSVMPGCIATACGPVAPVAVALRDVDGGAV